MMSSEEVEIDITEDETERSAMRKVKMIQGKGKIVRMGNVENLKKTTVEPDGTPIIQNASLARFDIEVKQDNF